MIFDLLGIDFIFVTEREFEFSQKIRCLYVYLLFKKNTHSTCHGFTKLLFQFSLTMVRRNTPTFQ